MAEPTGSPTGLLRARIVVALVLLALAFVTANGGAQPLVRKLNELARSAPPRASAGAGADHAGGIASGSAFVATDDAMPRPGEIARALRAKVEQQTPVLLAQLVAALVVFGFFYLLQRVIVRLMRQTLRRAHADTAVSTLGVRFTRYTLLGIGVLAALQQLGVQVTSLLAGVGIAGLAVGLAAQDTIANLIAGFTLLLEKPFRIGDNVTIAGVAGEVVDIGLRSTRLRTVETRDAFLPNREIITKVIVNHTMTPDLRVDLPVGVSYSADLDRVREVLLGVVVGHELIHDQPAPRVVVVALAESTVNVQLRFFLRSGRDEPSVRYEILERMKKALDAAGIEIPFPQRVVQVLPPPAPNSAT